MPGRRLKASLTTQASFVVVAELTGGPGYSFAPVEGFLRAFQDRGSAGIPESFEFAGIMSPQNPGGTANIAPSDVLAKVFAGGLLGPLDFIPHISCKDHNTDALISSLVGFRAQGVESVLALTGDKPVSAKGVFEVESVGLLRMIRRMNHEAYLKARPEDIAGVGQFYAGAAVSPFKYSRASQMQQYYKMEKKLASGAQFLVTQVGWDWRKSLELMRYLEDGGLDVPVLGNVYLLSTTNPAPRLMHDGKLPGCFVSDELYGRLQRESLEQHIERAAQQVAMYRSMGAAGVDIGGVHDYEVFVKILKLADEIGADWERHKDNLCWPGGEEFYLYDDNGARVALPPRRKKLRQRVFNLAHRAILTQDTPGFLAFRRAMRLLGAKKGKGFVYRSFHAAEKWMKYLAFDCEDCGDCHLPEDFGYCTMGGCMKGLANAPCGDSTVDGRCGNDLERVCIGDFIYDAALAEPDGEQLLRERILPRRDPALEHTASILNYLFGLDHARKRPLIAVGDALNASSPTAGAVMRQLVEMGPQGFTQPSAPLSYIRAVIESQADEGADAIAVNVDAAATLGELGQIMAQYVGLVRKWGGGTPVCIDSEHPDVVVEGLRAWYDTDHTVRPPFVVCGDLGRAEEILRLKTQHDFAVVACLGKEQESASAAVLFDRAKAFLAAAAKGGLRANSVFFDLPLRSLVQEPLEGGRAGQTYETFQAIREIKRDPMLRKAHCLLRIDTAMRGIPGRKVGVCRAFVAAALDCGLDSGFLDVAYHYGESPADTALRELVDAFAGLDGSAQTAKVAAELLGKLSSPRKKTLAAKPPIAIEAVGPDGAPKKQTPDRASADG